jgi:hypothetical protein
LHDSYSLKDKRQVLRSLLDKCKKFNISIAETDFHDIWNCSELTFAVVSNEEKHIQSIISNAISLIEEDYRVEILEQNTIL